MGKVRRRQRAVSAVVAALTLSFALAACTPSDGTPVSAPTQIDTPLPGETVQQLQDATTRAMAAAGASGAIVGVWAPWSGAWVTGLGTQSPSSGTKVTDDMRFRVAQLTRPMVCDVLFDLVDAGTVKLDDSIAEWAPGVPDLRDVTLQQLCDGTSGIGSYGRMLSSMWLTNPTREWDPRELASYGLGQKRTRVPGEAYADSSAGYVLLGLALERAAGKPMSELIAEHVAEPLGLESTVLPPSSSVEIAEGVPVLRGYHSLQGEDGAMNCTDPLEMTQLSASVGYADAGVVSDIRDLGRYTVALAEGELTPDGIDRFADALPAYAGAPSWYNAKGGALMAGSLIGQVGWLPGYAVAAWSDPQSGLTIAVVLNNSRSSVVATYLSWELAAIASKAPPMSGQSLPEAGLPFTAEQYHTAIGKAAICPIPES